MKILVIEDHATQLKLAHLVLPQLTVVAEKHAAADEQTKNMNL